MAATGKTAPIVGKAVQALIDDGIMIRTDETGDVFDHIPQGSRGKYFYSLSKSFNKNILKRRLVKKFNQLKILTSTGKKSLHYKTNSYKTKTIGDANFDKKCGKVENSNSEVETHEKKGGIKRIGQVIEGRFPISVTDDPKYDDVHSQQQATAVEIMEMFGLDPTDISNENIKKRIVAACKEYPQPSELIRMARAAESRAYPISIDDSYTEARLKYFFKSFSNR